MNSPTHSPVSTPCSPSLRGAVLLALCLLAGCGDDSAGPVDRPAPVFGDATLRGRVAFVGTPPPARMLANDTCHAGARPIPDETVVIGPSGGLANVVVYLEGVPASDGSSRDRVTMDQNQCQFIPHVVGLQVGQTLRVTTSDPVFHNVHYLSQRNGTQNIGLPKPGDFHDFTFNQPEFIRLRCDVHPWMSAWVGVLESPFFAVTDLEGNFEIRRIPPGQYTLVTWHELYGEQRTPVTLEQGLPTTLELSYGK